MILPEETLRQIFSLPRQERIELIQILSESIDAEADTDLTEELRDELARRLQDHHDNPDDVIPWEEVKANALARARR